MSKITHPIPEGTTVVYNAADCCSFFPKLVTAVIQTTRDCNGVWWYHFDTKRKVDQSLIVEVL